MIRKFILFTAITFLSATAFTQEVNKKIDEHAKNPKTKENAAKADVFVVKKTITDSIADYNAATVKSKKVTSTGVKKKSSKKKSSSNK